MPDRQTLAEAGTVTLTETTTAGTALVTLITPGQGSSGQYSPEVLEAAADAGVFAAGTQMFLDHPQEGERPERSLDRLAGVLTEAATWDGTGLKASAKIYPRFRSMLAEMQDDIGVSIRAGGVIENGVVQSIGPVASVDFVTKAGRGGSFALVESAVIVEGHGMTANDLSQAVSDAVRDAYGAQDTYTWVRDYTDEWAVYSIETPDSTDLFQQAYTVTGGVVTLTGDRTPVVQKTVFEPVTEAAAPLTLRIDAQEIWKGLLRLKKQGRISGDSLTLAEATPLFDELLTTTQTPATEAGQPASDPLPVPTQESQEDAMPELTEAEVQTLRESAEQLPTVTAERDAARAELAAYRRGDAARPIVTAALAEANISARTRTRLTESLVAAAPATDTGDLDEDALTAAIEAARTDAEAEAAELLAESGYGLVVGLGTGTTPLKESDAPSAEYAAIYGTEA